MARKSAPLHRWEVTVVGTYDGARGCDHLRLSAPSPQVAEEKVRKLLGREMPDLKVLVTRHIGTEGEEGL